uniref:Putative nucleoredoxin 1 n=1 Tax=Anthurium amnicola TaxID=1678845 RepID=A0A1D1Y6X4_9ARAE
MEKLEHELLIHHFSHKHPLELTNGNPSMNAGSGTASCAGCNQKLLGWVYGCHTCDYYIDISCAQLPPQINHAAHPSHTLSLYTSPVYPEGSFDCDACGQKGTGFCFHCEDCELDLHVTCAAKPLLFMHGGHKHPLALTPASPYGERGFDCDVCGRPGSSQLWLYRCEGCQFDAHLWCVTSSAGTTCDPMARQQQYWLGHHRPQQGGLDQYVRRCNTSAPAGVAARTVNPGGTNRACHHGMGLPSLGIPLNPLQRAGRIGLGNGLAGSMVHEFMNGMAQQAGQDALQAILGGGDPSGVITGSASAVLGAVIGTMN